MRGIEGPKTSVSRSPTDEFGCATLSPRAKFTLDLGKSPPTRSDGNVGEHTDFICSWYFCY
jgi:hypothetical protein